MTRLVVRGGKQHRLVHGDREIIVGSEPVDMSREEAAAICNIFPDIEVLDTKPEEEGEQVESGAQEPGKKADASKVSTEFEPNIGGDEQKPPAKTKPAYIKAGQYWCTKCERCHIERKGKGVSHLKYKG